MSMKPTRRVTAAVVASAALAAGAATQGTTPPRAPSPPASAREQAYRSNNRGVALLEQFRPQDAAEAFREALGIDPGLEIARINLAIALFNVPDLGPARKEAEAAARPLPTPRSRATSWV
jgi:tetratricopeptide (TPR) repeat protein